MLGLLELDGVDAFLTETGRAWHTADIQRSKQLFAALVVERAPLVRTICRTLENTDDGSIRDDFFLDLLRRGLSDANAKRQLQIAIDWGRYAELFDYDVDSGELVLTEVSRRSKRMAASPVGSRASPALTAQAWTGPASRSRECRPRLFQAPPRPPQESQPSMAVKSIYDGSGLKASKSNGLITCR